MKMPNGVHSFQGRELVQAVPMNITVSGAMMKLKLLALQGGMGE